MGWVAPAITAVAAAGSAVHTMTQSQDTPEPPKPPEAPTTALAEEQAKEDLKRRQKGAVGKEQTIHAGLLTEEANTTKKTLLG